MEIRAFKEINSTEWNEFIKFNKENACFAHLYEWIENVESKIFGATNYSFAVVLRKKIVCIFPLVLYKFGKFLFRFKVLSSLAHYNAGYLIDKDLDIRTRKGVFKMIKKYILKIIKDKNIDYAEIKFFPLSSDNLNNRLKYNPGFRLDFLNRGILTYMIDLSQSEKKIYNNFESRARNEIEKARRAGVKVEIFENYDEYNLNKILKLIYGKINSQLINYFKFLFEKKLIIALLAKNDSEKVIAASVFAIYNKKMHYWFNGSVKNIKNLGHNSILMWNAILWGRRNGYSWMDVGPYYSGNLNFKFKNLSRFKKSFGGELYNYYKSLYINSKIKFKIFELYCIIFNKEFHFF